MDAANNGPLDGINLVQGDAAMPPPNFTPPAGASPAPSPLAGLNLIQGDAAMLPAGTAAPSQPSPASQNSQQPARDELFSKLAATGHLDDGEWRRLYAADRAMGFGDYAKGFGRGLADVAATVAKGIAEPFIDPDLGRLAATPGEALGQFGQMIGEPIRQGWAKVADTAADYGDYLGGNPNAPEDAFARYRQRMLDNAAAAKVAQGNLSPDWARLGGDPYHNLAAAAAMVVDPFKGGADLLKTGARAAGLTTAAKEAAEAVAGRSMRGGALADSRWLPDDLAPGANPVVDNSGVLSAAKNAAAQPLLGKLTSLVGSAAAALGKGAQAVGELPENLVNDAVDRIGGGGEAAAAAKKFIHGGESLSGLLGFVAGNPHFLAAGAFPGMEKVGQLLQRAGEFAQAWSRTYGDSIAPRLQQMARSADASSWVKSTAAFLDGLGAGNLTDAAVGGAASALKGAAAGGAIGALTSENPEQAGEMAGSGVAIGPLSHGASYWDRLKVVKTIQNHMDRLRFIGHLAGTGTSPDVIARISDGAFDPAMTQYAAQIHALAPCRIDFHFQNDADYRASAPRNGQDTAGYYRPAKPELNETLPQVFVNAGSAKNATAHEVQHAIDAALGADDESRALIDTMLSPEQIEQAAQEYSKKLGFRPAGTDWVYSEIAADAAQGAVGRLGGDLQRLINPSVWQRIGDSKAADFLRGVFGADMESRPKSALFSEAKIYGPEMRRMIYERLRRFATPDPQSKVSAENAPPVIVPAGRVAKQFPDLQLSKRAAQKQVLQRQRAAKAEFGSQLAKPLGDTSPEVAPRRTPGGKIEVSGTKLFDRIKSLPGLPEWQKRAIQMAEGLMNSGRAFTGLYWRREHSGESKAAGFSKNWSNVPVEYQELAPGDFLLDKQGNISIRGWSPRAARLKMARWLSEGKLGLWNGGAEAFQKDLSQVLRNHFENQPGEANGVGIEKKNLLNAFILGDNKQFADKNPLRGKLAGLDKQGILRSMRVDSMGDFHESGNNGWFYEYGKKTANFAPGDVDREGGLNESASDEKDKSHDERGGVETGRGGGEPLRAAGIGAGAGRQFDAGGNPPLAPGAGGGGVKYSPGDIDNGGILSDNKGSQDEFDFARQFGNAKVASKAALREGVFTDPSTGLLSFMRGGGNYDLARERIRTKAVHTIVRNFLAELLRAYSPESVAGKTSRELDIDLSKSAGGSKETRAASDRLFQLLQMPDAEFARSLEGAPAPLVAAGRAARVALPVIDPDSAIARAASGGTSRIAPLGRDAEGSEGIILRDKQNRNIVYKVFHIRSHNNQPGGLALTSLNENNNVPGNPPQIGLNVNQGTVVDLINKLQRASRLPGFLPVEIQGFLPTGQLVVKMRRMARAATTGEAHEWIAEYGEPAETGRGSEGEPGIIGGAVRNQPIIRHEGNHYAAADVREGPMGEYGNLMVDREGRVLATDVAVYPIDAADADRMPVLKSYAPENPDKILYSPGAKSGAGREGDYLENEDFSQESERAQRRYSVREARQLMARMPEAVPVRLTKEGTIEKVPYGLADAPMVKRSGPERAAQIVAGKIAREVRRAAAKPEISDAFGWHAAIRDNIQRVFGANGKMFAQLLAATSARTGVRENWRMALDAVKNYAKGGYDGLLSRYAKFIAGGGKDGDWQEMPLKSNGQKFSANSRQVLRVLAGDWAEKAGLKTAQFAGNLSGNDDGATIDVWSARTLRRLMYQGETKQWRILPPQEKGVAPKDFAFAQDAMRRAGGMLGISPEDVQSLLWFAEKDLWQDKRWTRGAGAEKSSYNTEFDKMAGNPLEGELSGVSQPHEPARFAMGVSTYKDAAQWEAPDEEGGQLQNRAQYVKSLARTRQFLGKLRGVMAARARPTTSIYGDPEPSFDVEATVRDARDADKAEQYTYNLGRENLQTDTFFARACAEDHPNARIGVRVMFRRPVDMAAFGERYLPQIRDTAGGATLITDPKGRVEGFWTHYAPEIQARFAAPEERALELDPGAFFKRQRKWAGQIDNLLDKLDPNAVLYTRKEYYDTRHFGIEEKQYPARPAQTSRAEEFARRAAVLR